MTTVSPVGSSTTAASTAPKTDESSSSNTLGEFEKILKANLTDPDATQTSEEALFAAIIPERLTKLKDADVAKKFTEALKAEQEKLKKGDGFIPYEDAAKNALRKLRTDNVLTKEEADKVYSESFTAAQLDSNTDSLYDDRGGAGDPTIAVKATASALSAAKLLIDKISSDPTAAVTRSLDEVTWSKHATSGTTDIATVLSSSGTFPTGVITPKGTAVDGDGGFLFKPESQNGKLAILSPNAIGAMVDRMLLKTTDGATIEEGRFTSFGDDGRQRAKYEFSKPGRSYPKNLTVEILYKDGQTAQYQIEDPSKRYD